MFPLSAPGSADRISRVWCGLSAAKPRGPWTQFKTLDAGELGWYVPIIGQRFQTTVSPTTVKCILYPTGNYKNKALYKLNYIPITLSTEPLEHKDPTFVGGR